MIIMLTNHIETWQCQKLVSVKTKGNSKPTNFFQVRYEDSTTQTDTKAKEGDNEHSEMNIRINAINLHG